jgi:hypothetical protein
MSWKDKPCKLWTGSLNTRGYGHKRVHGKLERVHRLAYAELHGPIIGGTVICHHCNVKSCYEITHLYPGTQQENVQQAVADGLMGKLNPVQVQELREKMKVQVAWGEKGRALRKLAAEYGVTSSALRSILRNETWQGVV